MEPLTPITLLPKPLTPATDSRRVLDLEPMFRQKVMDALKSCRDQGVTMLVTSTIRGPETQARLWCQSRRPVMIVEQAKALARAGAPWLASFLRPEYYIPNKDTATKALPGASWHQWSEAVDCVVTEGKLLIWNVEHKGWAIYVKAGQAQRLTSLHDSKTFPEWPHLQLRPEGSPLSIGMKWPAIEAEMKKRFGA